MRKIAITSDWEIVRDMTEWSAATGAHVAKSGLTLTGFLSATRDGAAIHSSLSKPLVEVGSTGRYGAATAATDHATHLNADPLTSYLGRTIYERVTGTGYSDYEELTVVMVRQAGA
jgi:hypothetical protein